ncbi:hypothetical protein [Loigolactobacillus bifermentans]|jgi:hypothetical protein|uniref:Uncharacterized protein n=1 Tax=Loigolactobacillus bifermentans DSM 20003 TaxID=1423726 RepID=A0A0R1H3J0_9LACO|nr:hypothetical protein [Loigolactobacillus bifermentans]KRK40760.1 hypothetical protein FC07_GL002509 [Loigolactobacillus bifermentans DSM 20003]QGG59511.1 hypothetical protein LB003_02920 [Loigolactobacillus bifermentans]
MELKRHSNQIIYHINRPTLATVTTPVTVASEPQQLTVQPQMPGFQIDYYLEQAIDRHFLVTVQFNDFDHGGHNKLTGFFERHGQTVIFKAQKSHLIHLVMDQAIRYIQRVAA